MFEDKTKWDRERIMNFSGVNEKENLYKNKSFGTVCNVRATKFI